MAENAKQKIIQQKDESYFIGLIDAYTDIICFLIDENKREEA